MKHLMKKLVVGFVAAVSVATIAYADSSKPAEPELVEIVVTVTKDLGKSVDLPSKVSMRTEKDKPFVTADRRTITFRSAIARSNNEKFNYDKTSEISVGVDATYIPASNSSTDTAEPAQVLVTIDDLTGWRKFTMSPTLETFEMPSISRKRVYVPIDPGRTSVVKQGNYTVTVTERAVTN